MFHQKNHLLFSFLLWVMLASIIGVTSCGEDDKSGSNAKKTETKSETKLTTTTTQSNIENVATTMLPGSLAVTPVSNNLYFELANSNPCEGTSGFFDCQPRLLKHFLSIGKQIVSMVSKIMSRMEPILSTLEIGSTGSLTPDSAEDITKVEYNIESASKYSLLFHTSAGVFLHLLIDGLTYTMKVNIDRAPASKNEQGASGQLHAIISYTASDEFNIDIKLANRICQANDVRAPQNLAINIKKNQQAWQGKAMLYMPRWLFAGNSVSCDTPTTDNLAITLYSDFVGDDTNTTAAIYLAPRTKTDTDFTTFSASNFCTNFNNLCSNGYGFGDSNPISNYTNNFCVTSSTSTWGQSCTTSTNSLISEGTFSDASLWIAPSELVNQDVTIPDSL